MQSILDELYEKSSKGYNFTDLMKYITSEANILLAYRNIKNNKGSMTVGTDGKNINMFSQMDKDEYINLIRRKFENYFPKSVRRVEIPKPNGGKRPLGIPCIDDRIIQQCIKQILEPICEAKFYKYSFGFRPNRATKHAIARCNVLVNTSKLHYAVDIDIKGFFDNVNHAKLKKQIWSMGIRDKNLISIIGKILKSEIEGVGIATKGTPQGGIISPLLANIVLNEFDWWIASQWDTMKTKHEYYNKGEALKKTNLKEIKLTRYADDIMILCRDYKSAFKILKATKLWLKERLDLDTNDEKSKVVNLRKNYSNFLGLKLKAKPKGKKFVCYSRMSDKAFKHTVDNMRKQINIIKKYPEVKNIMKLNSMILGMHNYYKIATHITIDTDKIDFLVRRTIRAKLSDYFSSRHSPTKTYQKLYGQYKYVKYTIKTVTLYPIGGIRHEQPRQFDPNISNYTSHGRELIHKNLKGYEHLINRLLNTENDYESVELRDNKISLIIGQKGKCYVTGTYLNVEKMECHHKKPKEDGGDDSYNNLVWLNYEAHKLVHCTKQETINKYLEVLQLDENGIRKVNSLRKLVGNSVI